VQIDPHYVSESATLVREHLLLLTTLPKRDVFRCLQGIRPVYVDKSPTIQCSDSSLSILENCVDPSTSPSQSDSRSSEGKRSHASPPSKPVHAGKAGHDALAILKKVADAATRRKHRFRHFHSGSYRIQWRVNCHQTTGARLVDSSAKYPESYWNRNAILPEFTTPEGDQGLAPTAEGIYEKGEVVLLAGLTREDEHACWRQELIGELYSDFALTSKF
jgi:hypothetical protein